MRERLAAIIGTRTWEAAIATLIVLNAVTLGLETSPSAVAVAGPLLYAVDRAILAVFVVELAVRLYVRRLAFFRDPWSVFDLAVVLIALLPASGPFQVLRAMRILRVLRLISVVPSLRRVVSGLINALPGMGSILLLLSLVFYMFAVMATKLFGGAFPELFGTLGASAYTLFQVMTLEGWSDAVARPVMETSPYAWLFFIPFILSTSFVVLNLFIGVIVSAMQEQVEAAAAEEREEIKEEAGQMHDDVRALRREVGELRALLERAAARPEVLPLSPRSD